MIRKGIPPPNKTLKITNITTTFTLTCTSQSNNSIWFKNLTNLQFVSVTHETFEYFNGKLPKTFTITCENETLHLALESVIISVEFDDNILHAISGLICDSKMYIHDSSFDTIFLTNLELSHIKNILKNSYSFIEQF